MARVSVTVINNNLKIKNMAKVDGSTVTTNKARLSHFHGFEPVLQIDKKTLKFACTFLFPKIDIEGYNALRAAEDAAFQKGLMGYGKAGKTFNWTTNPPADTAANPFSWSIQDGDSLTVKGKKRGAEAAGMWVVTVKSDPEYPPTIVDWQGNDIPNTPEGRKLVYSGAYARGVINFYPFDTGGNAGIAASFNGLQKLEDGVSLAGSVDARSAFADGLGSQYAEANAAPMRQAPAILGGNGPAPVQRPQRAIDTPAGRNAAARTAAPQRPGSTPPAPPAPPAGKRPSYLD